MSNEKALQDYERQKARRQADYDKAYKDRFEGHQEAMRNNFEVFGEEYEERLATQLLRDDPFLKAIHDTLSQPYDAMRMRRLHKDFALLIYEMAQDRMDFEIESGGLDE